MLCYIVGHWAKVHQTVDCCSLIQISSHGTRVCSGELLLGPATLFEQQVCRCAGSAQTLVSPGKYGTCSSASSFHALNPFFIATLICRLQEVGEHVPRHGLQQHLGDAGCHDLGNKGHRRCHDSTERISADVPKVSHIFWGKKEKKASCL